MLPITDDSHTMKRNSTFRMKSGCYQYWRENNVYNLVSKVNRKPSAGAVPPQFISTYYVSTMQSTVRTGSKIEFSFEKKSDELRHQPRKGTLHTCWGIPVRIEMSLSHYKFRNLNSKDFWNEIQRALFETCPELSKSVSTVVCKGTQLYIVMAIKPLPILESTATNQLVALRLQQRVISYLQDLGFAADSNWIGLEKEIPNYKDQTVLIFQNEKVKRRAELHPVSTSYLGILHGALNAHDKRKRKVARLCSDARVEAGLAKLFLYLLGEYQPASLDLGYAMEHGILRQKEWLPRDRMSPLSWMSFESIHMTITEMAYVTGAQCSESFLRRFISDCDWLVATRMDKKLGWSLAINQKIPNFAALYERALLLNNASSHCDDKVLPKNKKDFIRNWKIDHPKDVLDGKRNDWLWRLAAKYKCAGYSEAAALRKIALRIPFIQGVSQSRNLSRNLKQVVRSVFRNFSIPESKFCVNWLPDWAISDEEFQGKVEQPRAKDFSNSPCMLKDSTRVHVGISAPNLSSYPLRRMESNGDLSPVSESRSEFQGVTQSKEMSGIFKSAHLDFDQKSEKERLKLAVVHHHGRVGIFDGKDLVSCLKERKFKLKEWKKRAQELLNAEITIFYPSQKNLWKFTSSLELSDEFELKPRVQETENLLYLAQSFANLGYSVIPIESAGKQPAIDSWKQAMFAPADEETVETYFGTGARNLGIVTGAVSGIVVVDCDSDEAVEWVQTHLPPTPFAVRTAKGMHFYYRHPGMRVRSTVRFQVSGKTLAIDIKGDGGYVVGPKSKHASGVTYQVVGKICHPQDLPIFSTEWFE